ncbi:MAG: hypothetical protein Q9214_001525 [Letrouitia sp. 1 TL-2023]
MSPADTKKVICEAIISPDATQYYGRLVISRIRYEDDSPVTIQEFLGVAFKSPKSPKNDPGIRVEPEPWINITPDINFDPIDDKTIAIRVALSYSNSQTFDIEKEKPNFEIDGGLTDKPDFYTASVELYADDLPSGIVKAICPALPDTAFARFKQTVPLKPSDRGIDLHASLGANTTFRVPSGIYAVTADEPTTPEQTVVATAQVAPDAVTVKIHEETLREWTYDAVSNPVL